jgi:hypothetical protein
MNHQHTDWSDGLSRLVALAERFAGEGQMNLNKLAERRSSGKRCTRRCTSA